MTEKPILDYFIVDGKVINRGDDGFDELEAKYVKEVPTPAEFRQQQEKELENLKKTMKNEKKGVEK